MFPRGPLFAWSPRWTGVRLQIAFPSPARRPGEQRASGKHGLSSATSLRGFLRVLFHRRGLRAMDITGPRGTNHFPGARFTPGDSIAIPSDDGYTGGRDHTPGTTEASMEPGDTKTPEEQL